MFTISFTGNTAGEAFAELLSAAALLAPRQAPVNFDAVPSKSTAKRIAALKAAEAPAPETVPAEPLPPPPAPEVAAEDTPAAIQAAVPALTIEEMREYLMPYLRAPTQHAIVLKLLAEFKVERLSALPPDRFDEFKARAVALLS